MSPPDVTSPPELGAASPLAARLSSVAYMLGFMCLSFVGLFLALPFLVAVGTVPWYLLSTVQKAFVVIMLLMSLSTFVTAIVAFSLMGNVRESAIEKKRAGRGMIMGFTGLCIPFFVLILIILDYLSGGHL